MNHFDPTRALGVALAASLCVTSGCATGLSPEERGTSVEEAGIAAVTDSAAPDVFRETGGFGLDAALADDTEGALDSGVRDSASDSSAPDDAVADSSAPEDTLAVIEDGATIDTTVEDAGIAPLVDTAIEDTGTLDTAIDDTAIDDTGALDTGTSVEDTGTRISDTGALDTETVDTTVEDTGAVDDTASPDSTVEDSTIEDSAPADSAPEDSGAPDTGPADTFVYVPPTVRVVAPSATKLGYNKSSDVCQGASFRAEYTASAGVRSVQWKFYTPNAATATTAMLGTCTGAAAYGYFLDPAGLSTSGTFGEDVAIAGLYSGPAGAGRWWWCTAPGTAPQTAVDSPPSPGAPGVQTLANYCAAKSTPPDSDLGSRWRLEITLTDKTGAIVTDNFYFWVHQ